MATWPVTLADAKAELNIPTADTSQDTELQAFIDAVTGVVEGIVGPVNSTSYTEWFDGGTPEVVLAHYPVLTVTSVTEYSNGSPTTLAYEPLDTTTTFTDAGYQYDPTTGVIVRTSGGVPIRFPFGTRNVNVAYSAGRATPPAAVHLGALELLRLHWVPSQRGFTGTFGQPGEEFTGTTLMGFFVPNKVMDLLIPYRKAPIVV